MTTNTTALVSQDLFDDILLENQEMFDYDDDQAVQEAIQEIRQQQQQQGSSLSSPDYNHSTTLDYLSLTHPNSQQGQHDRRLQKTLVECLTMTNYADSTDETDPLRFYFNVADAISILKFLSRSNKISMAWSLILLHRIFDPTSSSSSSSGTNSLMIQALMTPSESIHERFVDLTLALLPDSISIQDQLCKAVKIQSASVWLEISTTGTTSTVNDDNNNANGSSSSSLSPLWFRYLSSLTDNSSSDNNNNTHRNIARLLHVARTFCNGVEHNKKLFVRSGITKHDIMADGIQMIVQNCLVVVVDRESYYNTTITVAREACQLVTVLCKFQPLAEQQSHSQSLPPSGHSSNGGGGGGEPPMVSSAHANVKEFHRVGAVSKLYKLAYSCLNGNDDGDDERTTRDRRYLLCDAMTALRVMAIDNDIVQNMVALGILDIIQQCLELATITQVDHTVPFTEQEGVQSGEDAQEHDDNDSNLYQRLNLALVTATFGLVRNLCANDEIKTTICKSSLDSIVALMQSFQESSSSSSKQKDPSSSSRRQLLQEHGCGILAAMSLKQPQNATSICDLNGHILILNAMQTYTQSVTVQRQACLAIRNIASRVDSKHKQTILDAGAERIIQQTAGCHQGSIEEAYAALRDLGCNPKLQQLDEDGTLKGTQEFGKVTSNFRPVYE